MNMRVRSLDWKYIYTAIVFIIAAYWTYPDFSEFHTQQVRKQIQKISLQHLSFQANMIQSRTGVLLNMPDKQGGKKFASFFAQAKKRIYMEIYMLSEKDVITALIDAKKRGVDVRVILEGKVYGNPKFNKKAFEKLQSAGISCVYADNNRYTLTHSKFIIIDDLYVLGTGNFTHGSFTQNREWYFIGDNTTDMEVLVSVFQNDFAHTDHIYQSGSAIIIAPEDARTKLETTLLSAKTSIRIYAQTITDQRIVNILAQKEKEGVSVEIILGGVKQITQNKEDIGKFQSLHIATQALDKPFVHAKSFIVDKTYMYIGSINFTTNSLDRNREIGILYKASQKEIGYFEDTWLQDFQKSK